MHFPVVSNYQKTATLLILYCTLPEHSQKTPTLLILYYVATGFQVVAGHVTTNNQSMPETGLLLLWTAAIVAMIFYKKSMNHYLLIIYVCTFLVSLFSLLK